MAKNTQLANATVNEQADDLARRLDNGYLRIYDGTQPATADTAITSQTLLVELRYAATSAPAASAGVLSFADLTPGVAVATGTAAWFRALSSDGTTVVMDGTVGTSASTPNLTLPTTSITTGVTVAGTGLTHTVYKATSGY